MFLLLVAFVTVPWMLLAKPLYELQEHKKTTLAGYVPTASPEQAAIRIESNGIEEEVGEVGHGHDEV